MCQLDQTQTRSKLIPPEKLEEIAEKANENIELVFEALGINIDDCYWNENEIRMACPVHNGDNKSAFCYNIPSKSWRCFTSRCHEGNWGIIGLTKLLLNKQGKDVGFVKAAEWLMQLLSVDNSIVLSDESIDINKSISLGKIKQNLKKVKKETSKKFEPIPVDKIREGFTPSQYFLDRGFTEETLTKFLVGYCNDPSKPMYLRSYVPVLDEDGKHMIGVTGRITYEKCSLCGDFHRPGSCPTDDYNVRSHMKWLHWGFSSGTTLYNIWNAKNHIRKTSTVLITEGPKDVWFYDQNKIYNSVSIFGLNITQWHIKKLLSLGVLTVILGLDNDEAGLNTRERIYPLLQQYFKILNINNLFGKYKDIDKVDKDTLDNTIIPFINKVNNSCIIKAL